MGLSQLHPMLWPNPQSECTPMALGTWLQSKITWSSCDNHPTMCHPCHLVSRPSSWQTWDLRVPTLFLSNLFSSYCMLILLDCSTVFVCIPALIPDLEADYMCP